MSFTVLNDDNFFIRQKSSDQKKGNYVIVDFSQHNPKQEAQSEGLCDHTYKNTEAFPQINCNVKNVRSNRKATFHYKGKLQEVFRTGLNEIKCEYVDSKQHSLSTVSCCNNRHESSLQKTNDTSSSGVPRVYRAWGQTQF